MDKQQCHEAILDLMNEYCDSIDRGALEATAALFAQGAWGIAGDLATGSEDVLAVLDNVTLYDGVPHTRHLMSNVRIRIADDNLSAHASSCITVMQGIPGRFPVQAIFVGSYADEFALVDGQWIFRSRIISPDLVGDLSFHRSDMT